MGEEGEVVAGTPRARRRTGPSPSRAPRDPNNPNNPNNVVGGAVGSSALKGEQRAAESARDPPLEWMRAAGTVGEGTVGRRLSQAGAVAIRAAGAVGAIRAVKVAGTVEVAGAVGTVGATKAPKEPATCALKPKEPEQGSPTPEPGL